MKKSLTATQTNRLLWYLERGFLSVRHLKQAATPAPSEHKIVYYVDEHLATTLPEDECAMIEKINTAAFGEKQMFKIVPNLNGCSSILAVVILGEKAHLIQEASPLTVEIYHPQKMKRDLQLKIPTWNILKQISSR